MINKEKEGLEEQFKKAHSLREIAEDKIRMLQEQAKLLKRLPRNL